MPAGGSLQAALNSAVPGDVIVLEAGATYVGSFTLPNKSGSGWIIVRSSAADAGLPLGVRVSPGLAAFMPKLVAPDASSPVLKTAAGANHFRFIGIEIAPAPGTYSSGLVRLGTGGETSESALPHHLIFDRCYIHGDPNTGGKRGIALNSKTSAVIDSYLSDFKGVGQDTQAIGGWNGPGPFKIVNNYLEAAGENVMFGGADPQISGLVPADIEIRGNTFAKPLAWRGAGWSVKNLFELKNARRVVIDGNLFEYNWADAQGGTAVLFSVRNQDGTAPWTAITDVAFTNNVVRHASSGIKITGEDDTGYATQRTARVLVRNNVFDDISDAAWGGGGRLLTILYGPVDVTIEHNTGFATRSIITVDGTASSGFVFRNNVALHGTYGVKGSGVATGVATLNAFFPGSVFERNVLIGGNACCYPADNYFPATVAAVGFTAYDAGDYRLTPSSSYASAATDGKAVGVDFDALVAANEGAEAPAVSAPPPPSSAVDVNALGVNLSDAQEAIVNDAASYGTVDMLQHALRGAPGNTLTEAAAITVAQKVLGILPAGSSATASGSVRYAGDTYYDVDTMQRALRSADPTLTEAAAVAKAKAMFNGMSSAQAAPAAAASAPGTVTYLGDIYADVDELQRALRSQDPTLTEAAAIAKASAMLSGGTSASPTASAAPAVGTVTYLGDTYVDVETLKRALMLNEHRTESDAEARAKELFGL